MERILGKDLSVFRAISISLGQSKNENREGTKSKFVALTLKDEESIGARKVSHILFEDEIGEEAFEELMQCRKLDDANKPMLDSHNGYIIDRLLAKERSAKRKAQDDEGRDEFGIDKMLVWNGGMTMMYKFPTGARYANDADGRPVLDKDGKPVVKSEIEVFVQVKDVVIKDDGTRDYNFFSGMNPNTRGERLMRTFYKKPAENKAIIVDAAKGEAITEEPDTTNPPF